MGLKKLFKSVTSPIKKVLKSPLGKIAAAYIGYRYAPKMWGTQVGGEGGWGQLGNKLPPWLYAPAEESHKSYLDAVVPRKAASGILGKGIEAWKGMGPVGKAATVGIGAAGLGAATLPKEDLPKELTDDSGQQQYLTNRALFEDEWSDWLVDMGKAADKTEALEMVRGNPMFSEGGRVKAQGGLFAGQMPGRHPGMNQMRNPNMNTMGQGLGAPNLGPRSMGMTQPGIGGGGGQDPRMAQMMQQQRGPRTAALPKESEDTELIQLIKMLTSLGIPMEQLRGRTKEELVEMLVSVKGKGGQETIEGEVVEERNGEEAEAVEEEVVQAAYGGRIGFAQGSDRHAGTGSNDNTEADKANAAQAKSHSNQGSDKDHSRFDPGSGYYGGKPTPKSTPDGIFSNLQDKFNPNRITKRQNWMNQNVDKLVRAGLMKVSDVPEEGSFGDAMPALGYTYTGPGELGSGQAYNALKGAGYAGGFGTGGGGSQSYYTGAGTGTGTGAGTTTPSGDDYYKFGEWDQMLLPGETSTQAMMPGGYKKEILANTGGLMRTGYAMGTEHPVISSKDGNQLDMRDQGGYQPHGKAEKHDDVRALLAQGEFVMTSDAVKGMGGGDREQGAKKMYNLMHNMEAMA